MPTQDIIEKNNRVRHNSANSFYQPANKRAHAMILTDLIDHTCLIGLSYFDTNGDALKRDQLAGVVTSVNEENGISIRLTKSQPNDTIKTDQDDKIFVLPAHLAPWFKAPAGLYRDQNGDVLIENPDYFVTWDIHKTQDKKKGDHEWWEWVPCTIAPKVN
ncbi:MAG: hypothetical protein K6L81_08910 [Agarilytica sp.]